MQKAYQEGKDLYAVIAAACFHNSYYSNLEFLPKLVPDEPHNETVEVLNNSIKLLVDDEVMTNAGNKVASQLVSGDKIKTSDGDIIIKSVDNDSVYITIYL